MYHIKQDKRSEASAELIGEAMLKLLGEKEFKHISITDLQKESSVGRATFYRLFDHTEDVLEYLLKKQTDEYYNRYREIESNLRSPILKYAITCYLKDYHLLEKIVRAGKIGIIFRVISSDMLWMADLIIGDDRMRKMEQRDVEYFCAMMTAEVVGVLETWLTRNKRETAEELYEILRKHLEYSHYLYNAVQ